MTEKQFFHRSFCAPFLFPLFLWGFGALLQPFTKLVSEMAGYLIFAIIYGAVPYVALLVLFFLWQKGRSAKEIRYFTYLAPIFFTIIFLFFLFLFVLIDSESDFESFISNDSLWDNLYWWEKQAFLTALGYVVATHIAYYLFKQFNKINPNGSEPAV